MGVDSWIRKERVGEWEVGKGGKKRVKTLEVKVFGLWRFEGWESESNVAQIHDWSRR